MLCASSRPIPYILKYLAPKMVFKCKEGEGKGEREREEERNNAERKEG
jgi:hypothetical protein